MKQKPIDFVVVLSWILLGVEVGYVLTVLALVFLFGGEYASDLTVAGS